MLGGPTRPDQAPQGAGTRDKPVSTGVMEALRALAPTELGGIDSQEELNTALVHGMVASLGLEMGSPKAQGRTEEGIRSPSPTWIHPNLYYNTEEDRFSLKSDGDIFGCKDLHNEMVSSGTELSTAPGSPESNGSSSGSNGSGGVFEKGFDARSAALPNLKQDLSLNMKQLAAREERLSYLEIIMDLMRENKKLRAQLHASNAALQSVTFGQGHRQSVANARRTEPMPSRSKSSSVQTQTHPIQPEVRYMGNREMKQELKTLKSKLSKTRSEVRRLVTKRKTDQAMYEDKLKDANELIAQLRRTIATITTRQMNRGPQRKPHTGHHHNYYQSSHHQYRGQSG